MIERRDFIKKILITGLGTGLTLSAKSVGILGFLNKKKTGFFLSGNNYNKKWPDITGYTWAVLGDSITQEAQYIDDLVTYYSLTATNLGRSGDCLTTVNAPASPGFADRAASCYGKDLITIFGGVNDFYVNAPIGSILDQTESTFYGALNNLINLFTANSTDSILLFISPTAYVLTANTLGLYMTDYCNAIKQVCISRKVRFLWVHDVPGLLYADKNSADPLKKWTRDGLHFNELGGQIFANKIIDFIN